MNYWNSLPTTNGGVNCRFFGALCSSHHIAAPLKFPFLYLKICMQTLNSNSHNDLREWTAPTTNKQTNITHAKHFAEQHIRGKPMFHGYSPRLIQNIYWCIPPQCPNYSVARLWLLLLLSRPPLLLPPLRRYACVRSTHVKPIFVWIEIKFIGELGPHEKESFELHVSWKT